MPLVHEPPLHLFNIVRAIREPPYPRGPHIGITKYKAEQYVVSLEKAFILHHVFQAGTNVLREPKILMAPPNRLLYADRGDGVDGLREDFFA